jgi:hypothetical protein
MIPDAKACSRCAPVPAGDDGISMTFYSLLGHEVDRVRDLMPAKHIWWH